MGDKTEDTSKPMICADADSDASNKDIHNTRSTDPHWLINELNEILEKGMFKHD